MPENHGADIIPIGCIRRVTNVMEAAKQLPFEHPSETPETYEQRINDDANNIPEAERPDCQAYYAVGRGVVCLAEGCTYLDRVKEMRAISVPLPVRRPGLNRFSCW